MERTGDPCGAGGQSALMVTAAVLEEIGRYVDKWAPFESGGILIGNRVGVAFYAAEFVPLEGALPSSRRYQARAEYATRAILRADRAGQSVVATVHSHPDGSDEPSQVDLQNAYGYRDILHVVVHFHKGAPVCRVYQYRRTATGYGARSAALVIASAAPADAQGYYRY